MVLWFPHCCYSWFVTVVETFAVDSVVSVFPLLLLSLVSHCCQTFAVTSALTFSPVYLLLSVVSGLHAAVAADFSLWQTFAVNSAFGFGFPTAVVVDLSLCQDL